MLILTSVDIELTVAALQAIRALHDPVDKRGFDAAVL